METVLVVEDDVSLREFLRDTLVTNGFRVVEAGSAAEAEEMRVQNRPAAILLDLGLPDGDGGGYLTHVRSRARTPVIVLSARDGEADKVNALDGGADDYVTKPFRVSELLARLRVALRRIVAPGAHASPILASGPFRIDRERHQVHCDGVPVRLTPIEFRLLVRLAEEAGAVVPHRRLLADLWGPGKVEQVHYLRVHIGALRRKLEVDPIRPRWLTTEPGIGYCLRDR